MSRRQNFWLLHLRVALVAHLIEASLAGISPMMLASGITRLRVHSATAASDAVLHLHTTRTRLLHINGCVLACGLRRLAHRIHFSHLDYGALGISLSMQWSVATARHTLILQVWIGLRSVVLIVLLRPRLG